MANVSKTKVITGKNTRLSYFHGWEPTSINGGPERYSVSVLIPKDDKETVKAINDAIDIPVIASGGGGNPAHILDVFQKTDVSAALAASIFHFKTWK